jgi:hypothetical protein
MTIYTFRHRTQVTETATNQITYQSMFTVGIKVPDEFDNSNWTIAFMRG